MTILEEIQAKLESIQSNIEQLEAKKEDSTKSLEDELEAVRDRYKEDAKQTDKMIADYRTQLEYINYTLEAVARVAEEHEAYAKEVSMANTKAAKTLVEAISTGGASSEDIASFYDESKDLDIPDEYAKPELAAIEETTTETELQSTGT